MRRLLSALAATTLLATLAVQQAHAGPALMPAGPAHLVSEAGHFATEFEAAVDPTNPAQIAVAEIDFNKTLTYAGCMVDVSTDGGTTWRATNPFGALPGSDLAISADPRAVFDSTGKLHVLCLSADGKRLIYAHSTDVGQSWSFPTYFAGVDQNGSLDKPAMWVSPTGKIVVCALQSYDTTSNPPSSKVGVGIQISDDDGATWRAFAPPSLEGYAPTCTNLSADGAGHLYMGFLTLGGPKADPLSDGVIRSDDEGETWGTPVVYGVEKRLVGAPADLVALYTGPPALYSFFPVIETDPSSGDVFAATAWTNDDDQFRLVIERSTDNGATFTRLTPPAPPSHVCDVHMTSPILHADGQGRLALEYTCNDTSDSSRGGAHEVWLTVSLDHGDSWLAPALLTAEQIPSCTIPWISPFVNQVDRCERYFNGADYWFIGHGPGGFDAFWVDQTTGVSSIRTRIFSVV